MAVARVFVIVIVAAALWAGLARAEQPSAPPVAPNGDAPPAVPNATPPASPAPASHPPTPDDICRALEQDARGIAQFMPATADYRGLVDPFDPIEALKNSARYLRDLRARFGNLGLAAAAYNAGPGRVSAWLTSHRPLPGETRNYVAIITGWTADEWASANPPKTSETTIPQGVPCTRLANLILAPKEQAQRMAAYVPRWGMQLTANWSESKAWATYRMIQKQYAALIGDRE